MTAPTRADGASAPRHALFAGLWARAARRGQQHAAPAGGPRTPMSAPTLAVAGLAKRYGAQQVLAGVDLNVQPGQIAALLGPNGAGKTTLVSIVAGLRRADAGTVRIGDVDALARPQHARRRLAADGAAVLYSTHYLHEVETLDAAVTILDRGRVLACGAVDELLAAHARPAVELAFDGPAPELALPAPAEITADGARLRVTHPDPGAAAAAALNALGEQRNRLTSVEIVRPSLESVFLALTGRRYAPEGDAAQPKPRAEPEVDGVSSR